jgi:hypothetical protein
MEGSAMRTIKFIVCPQCHRTSYNPFDIQDGYCGSCHEFTAGAVGHKLLDDPAMVSETKLVDPLPAVRLMQGMTQPVVARCLHWSTNAGIRYECVYPHGHPEPHVGGVIGRSFSWTS